VNVCSSDFYLHLKKDKAGLIIGRAMNRVGVFTLIISLFLLNTSSIYGATGVLINEFAIETSPQSVELLNTASTSANLSGWHIDDNGGTTYFTIPDGTILLPSSCVVFSSEFNLNKSSADTVRLFDMTAPPTSASAHLIDSFSYKASSGSAVTYQRIPDGASTWATASASLGFYNNTHASCLVIPTPTPTSTPNPTLTSTPTPIPTPTLSPVASQSATITPTPTPSPTPTPTSTPAPVSYENIYLSEVMAYPDVDNEWAELYNDNDFDVVLSNWFIDDIESGGSSPKNFTITIAKKSYGVINFTTSMFNNDGDEVRLLDLNKNLKDSFEYKTAPKDQSIGRSSFESDEFCVQAPSKNAPNEDCAASPTPTPTPTHTPKPKTSLLSSTTKTAIKPTPSPSISSFKKNVNSHVLGIQTLSANPSFISSPKVGNTLESKNAKDPQTFVTQEVAHQDIPLLQSLTFTSISLSFLSVISMLLKIKSSL